MSSTASCCRICVIVEGQNHFDGTIQLGGESFSTVAAFDVLSGLIDADGKKRALAGSATKSLPLCPMCSCQLSIAVQFLWRLAAANEGLTKKAGKAVQSILDPVTAVSFRKQFATASGAAWLCQDCKVYQPHEAIVCRGCGQSPPLTAAAVAAASAAAAAADDASTSLTPQVSDLWAKFRPASDSWECSECMLRNKSDASKCVSCETKKPTEKKTAAGAGAAGAKPVTTDLGFANLVAQQSANKWECSGCMTRNEAQCSKCVCCETAKPGAQSAGGNSAASAASKFSFGAAAQKSAFTFGVPFNAGASAAAGGAALKANASAPTSFTFGVQPAEKGEAQKKEEKVEEEEDDGDEDEEEDASPAKRFKK